MIIYIYLCIYIYITWLTHPRFAAPQTTEPIRPADRPPRKNKNGMYDYFVLLFAFVLLLSLLV